MGRLHKRLKIVLVLMLLGITATHATVTTDKLTLVDCSDDTWQMALVSCEKTGDTFNVVADLAYSGNFTGHLHKVTLRLTNCGFRGICRNTSYANLEDVDCDAKILTNMDRYACIVTESLGTWGPLSRELNRQFISGLYEKICFTHEDVHINWDSSSSESDCTSSEHSEDSGSSSGEGSHEKSNSSSKESKDSSKNSSKNSSKETKGSHEKPDNSSKESKGSHEKSNSSSKESKGSREKSNGSSKETKGSHEKPHNSSKETKGSHEKPDHSSKESKDSKESPKDSSKETNDTSPDEHNGSSKPSTGSSTESSTR